MKSCSGTAQGLPWIVLEDIKRRQEILYIDISRDQCLKEWLDGKPDIPSLLGFCASKQVGIPAVKGFGRHAKRCKIFDGRTLLAFPAEGIQNAMEILAQIPSWRMLAALDGFGLPDIDTSVDKHML